jgi:sulfur-oxidizing protein SoxA
MDRNPPVQRDLKRVAACALAALLAGPAAGGEADTRRSGMHDMSPALQAMQQDDTQNPAMLWVAEGEALWQRDCASCHADAARSMRGAAARHPAFDKDTGTPVNLAMRIRSCQQHRAGRTPSAFESRDLLALEAYVALQSRGLPIALPKDSRLEAARAEGERLFSRRLGQLDLACTHCHDRNAGRRLAGSLIPQAHPTGYPIYRLEWQGLGSLQRRLRNCMTGVRAEPYAFGAAELVSLELFLAARAAGMKLESPGVRP